MSSLFSLCWQIRRWSSAQAREFGNLHNTVALLVLHSDVSSQRNVGELSHVIIQQKNEDSEFVDNAWRLIMLAVK